MRSTKIPSGLTALLIVLGLLLALAVVTYAQGPESDEPVVEEVGSQDEISGQGLSDPPPSGWEVLYMFTGAVDNSNAATVIHCTNFGSVNAEVKVEIFNYHDTSTTSATISIRSDETKTFSTRSTAIYEEDATLPSIAPIDQGSGRVLSPKSDIICAAQVLDPTNNPPEYMVKLTLFYSDGTPVDDDDDDDDDDIDSGGIYMPIITKNR